MKHGYRTFEVDKKKAREAGKKGGRARVAKGFAISGLARKAAQKARNKNKEL